MFGLTASGRRAINSIAHEVTIGGLIVRNVEGDLITSLKARAASHGRSAEAEHRDILPRALAEGSRQMPFGDMRGQIWIAPDFDETPDDILDPTESGMV